MLSLVDCFLCALVFSPVIFIVAFFLDRFLDICSYCLNNGKEKKNNG